MLKTMKYLGVVVITVLLVAIWLTACTPRQPAQQYTFRIGATYSQSALPYFVMQEQGLDKKHGLQFVETKYLSGEAILDAVLTGEIDMGISGSVALATAAERGQVPAKALAIASLRMADPEHPYIGVLAAHSVSNWQDLKGQQIAISSDTGPNTAAIKGRLQIEGINNYDLVIIPFANMGLAIAGGNVAAAVMLEPYITQSLLRNDGKFLGWVIGGPPLDRTEVTLWIIDTNFYQGQPQAVKAFLRAHLEAVKWIGQNPDAARSILAKRLNLTNEVSRKMYMVSYASDGHNDPVLLESMQPLLIDIGMLKAPIPASQLYNETLLNEVLSEKQ